MVKPLSIVNYRHEASFLRAFYLPKPVPAPSYSIPTLLFCDLVLAGAVLHPSPSPLPYLQPSHPYTTGLPSKTDKIACLGTKSVRSVPGRKQDEFGLNHLKIVSFNFRTQFVRSA